MCDGTLKADGSMTAAQESLRDQRVTHIIFNDFILEETVWSPHFSGL